MLVLLLYGFIKVVLLIIVIYNFEFFHICLDVHAFFLISSAAKWGCVVIVVIFRNLKVGHAKANKLEPFFNSASIAHLQG